MLIGQCMLIIGQCMPIGPCMEKEGAAKETETKGIVGGSQVGVVLAWGWGGGGSLSSMSDASVVISNSYPTQRYS